jgi:hypothetical protein
MLAMQTIDERADGTTRHLNGVGFKAKYPTNYWDAGNRIWQDDHQEAVDLLKAAGGNPVNNWLPIHRNLALRLLLGRPGQSGYLRQLTAWANGIRNRQGVSQFKLSALYNEESRTHKNYVAQQLNRQHVGTEIQQRQERIAELKRKTAELERETAEILGR